MMQSVEAEFTETQELSVPQKAEASVWTPSFSVSVDAAIEMKRQKKRFFENVMEKDKHYGVIPGTDKPTLLKPGAEMLLSNMGLQAEFSNEIPPILDFTGEDHGGEAMIKYNRQCTIYRQTGSTESDRMVIARASGSCSSREAKYRYRNAERVCPQCGKSSIINGKKEYGGGFLCFKKKGGCGAKFKDNDPQISDQGSGKVENPDIADLDNTILKMADKRALVAATLIATGCSDIFTQDVEDMRPREDQRHQEPQRSQSPSVGSLCAKALRLGVVADKEDFPDWVRHYVPGCQDIARGGKPTPEQCLAIDEVLEASTIHSPTEV